MADATKAELSGLLTALQAEYGDDYADEIMEALGDNPPSAKVVRIEGMIGKRTKDEILAKLSKTPGGAGPGTGSGGGGQRYAGNGWTLAPPKPSTTSLSCKDLNGWARWFDDTWGKEYENHAPPGMLMAFNWFPKVLQDVVDVHTHALGFTEQQIAYGPSFIDRLLEQHLGIDITDRKAGPIANRFRETAKNLIEAGRRENADAGLGPERVGYFFNQLVPLLEIIESKSDPSDTKNYDPTYDLERQKEGIKLCIAYWLRYLAISECGLEVSIDSKGDPKISHVVVKEMGDRAPVRAKMDDKPIFDILERKHGSDFIDSLHAFIVNFGSKFMDAQEALSSQQRSALQRMGPGNYERGLGKHAKVTRLLGRFGVHKHAASCYKTESRSLARPPKLTKAQEDAGMKQRMGAWGHAAIFAPVFGSVAALGIGLASGWGIVPMIVAAAVSAPVGGGIGYYFSPKTIIGASTGAAIGFVVGPVASLVGLAVGAALKPKGTTLVVGAPVLLATAGPAGAAGLAAGGLTAVGAHKIDMFKDKKTAWAAVLASALTAGGAGLGTAHLLGQDPLANLPGGNAAPGASSSRSSGHGLFSVLRVRLFGGRSGGGSSGSTDTPEWEPPPNCTNATDPNNLLLLRKYNWCQARADRSEEVLIAQFDGATAVWPHGQDIQIFVGPAAPEAPKDALT